MYITSTPFHGVDANQSRRHDFRGEFGEVGKIRVEEQCAFSIVQVLQRERERERVLADKGTGSGCGTSCSSIPTQLNGSGVL